MDPPSNTGSLLGLGLKFCLQSRRISTETIQRTMQHFKRDVRLKFLFAEQSMDSNKEYVQYKKLYIKSTWDPPLAFGTVERK